MTVHTRGDIFRKKRDGLAELCVDGRMPLAAIDFGAQRSEQHGIATEACRGVEHAQIALSVQADRACDELTTSGCQAL